MANEPLPGGRGYIWAKTEATYGSDPTLAAANVQYVENWESDVKPTMDPRTGISPFRAGFRPRVVGKEITWAGDVEIAPITVAAGGAPSDPVIDPWLRACGFGASVYADASPNTLTYTLLSHGHGSCAIEERFFNPAQTDGVGYQMLGCRADWTLSIDGGGIWRLSMDGHAKTGTNLAGPSVSTVDYGFDGGPVVGSQSVATYVSLDDNGDVTYGTGSLVAVVKSATISGNMSKSVQTGMTGAIGPARVVLNPEAEITCELVIEQQVDSEWDPRTYMLDQTGADNAFSMSIAATIGSNTVTLGTFYIAATDITNIANDEGRRMWQISHTGIYPEAGTDGGGIRPANNLALVYSTPD